MSLTTREKEFCLNFTETRNAKNAAAKAGYGVLAQRKAVRLMEREDIRKEIDRLGKVKMVSTEEVVAGYRQLAFGSVADALKLVCCADENDFENAQELDLFNISEIKRPKGGGIEIKFFDRIKALEHLEALSTADKDEDSALPFYMALEKSAKAIRNDADE